MARAFRRSKSATFVDGIVAFFILFPLITGGIWIRWPELRFELAEMAVPTLIATLVLSWYYYRRPTRMGDLAIVRVAARIWSRWRAALEKNPHQTLLAACSVWGCVLAFAAVRRHWAYETRSFDLGIFVNALWNAANGNGLFSSLKGGQTILADHFSPTLWLLAPLFNAFPAPETLLVFQSFTLAFAAWPLYFLARQYSHREMFGASNWLPAALPLLYFADLPIRNANAFDYHPETLLPLLAFSALVGLQSRSRRAQLFGALAVILSLGLKESIGPLFFGVGLAWLFGAAPGDVPKRRARWTGAICAALGLGTFIFSTQVLPKLLHSPYQYDAVYAQFGHSVWDLILAPIVKPALFLKVFFGVSRLKFLIFSLAPLAFLSFGRWTALLATLPALAMLFLGDGTLRVNPEYHYGIEPAIGIFWAVCAAIETSGDWVFRRVWGSPKLIAWVLFFALFSHGRSEALRIRMHNTNPHRDWLTHELGRCLDPSIAMTASTALVPRLALRHWVNHLPELDHAECAVFDARVNNWPLTSEQYETVEQWLPARGFQLDYSCGTVRVYARAGAKCRVCTPQCVARDASPAPTLPR